jgi:tyrosine-protein kinase Etk/Wzc
MRLSTPLVHQVTPLYREYGSRQPEENVGLRDILNVLRDSKWLVAGSIALALAATAAYEYLLPKTYEAVTLIQIEDGKAGNPSGVTALSETSAMFEVRSPASAEISILRSNFILEQAIDRLGLDVSARPRLVPIIGAFLARGATEPSRPGLLGMPGYVSGNESIQVSKFVVPRELEGKTFNITLTGTGYNLIEPGGNVILHGRIGTPEVFSVGGKPGQILVDGAVGYIGAEYVVTRHTRAALLKDLQRSLSIEEQGKQSGMLRVKLTGRDPGEVARILNEISSRYVLQNVERRVADVNKAMEFVSGNLPNLRSQLQQTEQQLSRVRGRRGAFDTATEGRLDLEQSKALQATLLELQRKRQDLQTTYLAQHPLMQAVEKQIDTVTAALANVGGRIKTMPALEQEVISLNRELKVNSDLYINLLTSAQQLGLAKQIRGGNVRVVDPARAPDEPAGPPAPAIMAMGATAGLVLGVSLALLRSGLRRGVTDPLQIEDEASIPVLTTVPLSRNQRLLTRKVRRAANDSNVLATSFPMDPAVDSLRNMLTLLPYPAPDTGANIVVITGPTHAVGKSFISLNLAAVFGGTGTRVLLIDGDLRRGELAKSVRVRHNRGFSDLLAGKFKFEEVVHREVMPHVDFISAGQVPDSPAELLWARSIREVLKEHSPRYGMVIIDSPPVLAAPDTAILAQQANASFLVARAEVTSMREIQASIKCLLQRGVHVKGVIFSGVDTSKRQNEIYNYSGYSYLSAR